MIRTEKKDMRDKSSSWKKGSPKKKVCPLKSGACGVDYKDARTLQKFTSERGKIMPCRISMVSNKRQRAIALSIKRARYLALLPYVAG